MINDYIPLGQYAELEELDEVKIKKCIYHKSTKFNYLRYKMKNKKLYVCNNFNAPLKDQLLELKNKALIISKNEQNLCKQLHLLSNKKIKESTIQKYFYRSRFKQIEKAIKVINLLKKYINENSLFPESDLNYD